MKPIFVIFIVLLWSVCAIGQSLPSWKPLPIPDTLLAYQRTAPVIADTIARKSQPSRVKEVYFPAKFSFQGTTRPVKKVIPFTSYNLEMDERIKLPGGMAFKDVSTKNIKYLDKYHGLPSNEVTSIAKAPDGRIYLGLDKALVLYNGVELEVYKGNDQFPLQQIRSLFLDAEDRLWISTERGCAYIYEQHLYVPNKGEFGPTHLKGFNENMETGELYVFTIYNGFFVWKAGAWHQYFESLPVKSVSSVIRSSDGKLWVVHSHDGISYIQNDSLFFYNREGVFDTPRTAFEYGGEIYFGQFAGDLLKYRNDSLFYVKVDDSSNHKNYSFAASSHGLWMSDYGQGVRLLKSNGELMAFTMEDGLAHRVSYALLADDFENIWVCDPFKGLSRIDQQLFYKLKKPIQPIVSQMVSHGQNMWYFTGGNGFYQETPQHYIKYAGAGNHCESGIPMSEDSVWITSADHGLILMTNNQYTFYTMVEDVELDSTIYTIQLDKDRNIWGLNISNQLYSFKEGTFYSFENQWENMNFVKLIKTRSNVIYVLTANQGVLVIDQGKYRLLSKENILSSDKINHVFEDAKSRLWYCSDQSIQVVDTTGKSTDLTIPGSPNAIHDIHQLTDSTYLLVSDAGILYMEEESEWVFWQRLYNKTYGLNLVGNTCISQTTDGEVMISGGDHLLTFDPYFLKLQDTAPKLSLNRIVTSDSGQVGGENLKVDQQAPLKFVFNNISWGSESTLFYNLSSSRHGSNKWNKISSNTLQFNQLSHGHYNLKVYATTSDDSKSNLLTFSFQVLPYWYQTSWFYGLCAVLIASSILIYLVYRERQNKKATLVLQQLVSQRTRQLENEKTQVVKQLQEKELLRQEVHHRVKNNLTFLKSLLYLRASATTNEDVKMILNECQSRIETMALVHQNLYDVENTSEVNFSTFIKELFVELHTLFDTNESVDINIEAEDLRLDMKLSIFIGLILNELFTNSFKYAFEKNPSGKITVMAREENGNVYIEYEDSGEGIDEFQAEDCSGFGFKIINILIRQTDATLVYENKKFLLTIPK